MMDRSHGSRFSLSRALLTAGLVLGGAVALKLLSPGPLGAELAGRLLGVLIGAAVILHANEVPKALAPLAGRSCDPIAEQATRRLVGWSLTLGGAGYVLASLIAPAQHATLLASTLLGASVVLVVVHLGWRRLRRACA
jgi:hypothetical protein